MTVAAAVKSHARKAVRKRQLQREMASLFVEAMLMEFDSVGRNEKLKEIARKRRQLMTELEPVEVAQ